ncbi:hypothetical protein T06_6188 [Trichinella sp. T6]|nr:hypothetical protein T06_6188 [Trichinella sp. T6]
MGTDTAKCTVCTPQTVLTMTPRSLNFEFFSFYDPRYVFNAYKLALWRA